MNKKKKQNKIIRVCTWNLLVPLYCNPTHYVNCEKDHLDSEQRFKKILSKFQEEMKNKNTIFVLQEVSREWGNRLKIWFNKKKYRFEKDHYGNKQSDFMGVAIAYPSNFKLTDYFSKVIGAQLELKLEDENYLTQLYYWARAKLGYRDNRFNDDVENAVRRKNVLLGLKLSYHEKTFWVMTYHMPCAFYSQNVMNWHASECLKEIKKLKKNCPVIFGGDFNSKPGSLVHKLFTNGEIQSAYLESDGKEPQATNYVETRRGYKFKACLDFIFYTKELLKLESTMILEALDKLMPNDQEPSDHLMIGASFSII